MIMIRDIISACFLFGGLFLCITTTVGMFRFPDFYSRCHASGNSETMGLLLTCVGFIIYAGFNVLSIKIIILFLFVCACNPVGSHVLTRAAYRTGFNISAINQKEDSNADTHH